MEVEEENIANCLHESTTTTVSNERLLENNCSNDKELGKSLSESNTQEEKGDESSVIVPKLDDSNPVVAVAVGETADEKEVTVQCGNSESGGCSNLAVVESTSALKDEKDDEDGDVKDEATTGDVAAVEHGDGELANSDKVDGGECQAVVAVRDAVRDNGLNVVAEENAKNSGEDSNPDGSLVIEDVKDGGGMLKDGGGVDVPLLPVTGIAESEEVTMDVKNDVVVDNQKANVETLQGEEAIAENQADFQEGMDANVSKEKGIAVVEKDALGVGEGIEEEGKMADEEKAVSVTENDEEEPMVADEEKSLDTELDTEEEATMADEEKAPDAEAMETELLSSSPKSTSGKRKRGGRNSKTTPKPKAGRRKMTEEDVCFICFDGGDLVLCDRRNCPKAYHPSCVNRDEAFFQTKGQWNCGWHLCSICEKKAEYMCYTCTFSLCKTCIKTNVIFCVREKEKKGLCEACRKTVMLIENNSEENQGNVDFDDKSSWEYLFKDYWTDMKAKLDLTLSELVEAKNAWKGSESSGKQEPPATHSDVKDDGGSGSENPSENLETRKNRRRNPKKRKSATKEEELSTGAASEGTSVRRNTEWASKELLEFVMHMGDGNESIRSQFDVQALLLEYIKANNLRDSRRKSQIICDARLERLFGKPRVGHFEMLKLLESHFLFKEDSQIDDIQGTVVDTEVNHVDDDEANETVAKGGKNRKRKMRKKGDHEPQSNREDYAAIDIHNISLIYLRRKLVEDLLDDTERFHSKVVGAFVRIRISGANLKQDLYRLVQVTGTTKAAQYTLGKKTTDTMLEVLNLNNTQSISIDIISNQDFMEDECKRLRQSIKCGLITRLTVGDILDKAMELQAAKVNDWLESEALRVSHLRDRASDLGLKKQLRECVEKLQVLKSPEERARKLEEIPLIHADPTMDPSFESQDDTDEEEKKQDMYKSSVGSRFSRRREYPSKESWGGRSGGKNYEFSRSLSNNSNNFSNKVDNAATSARLEPHNDDLRDQVRDPVLQQQIILKKTGYAKDETKDIAPKVNETEKMWHYKDPSGTIQGPFSMARLRRWSIHKYFPKSLRIWRKSEKEDNSILLTDAVEGRFTPVDHSPRLQSSHANLPSPTPNQGVVGLGPHVGPSSYHSGNEELQSPTPNSSQVAASLVGGGNKEPNAVGSLGHVVASPANNMPSQMVQLAAGQSLPVGPYGWSGGPPQPSLSSNVAGPHNQWGNVPNMVQNVSGNFLPQAPAQVNLQQAPPPPLPQPNATWPTLPANPNMGPVGPTSGNEVVNWGPTAQNPPWAGNVHPGWVPQPPAQGVPPNQGWVPGPVPGAGPIPNPNWVAPPGSQGASLNPGEIAVNQGPSNPSQGWGSPSARNRAMWDDRSGQKRNKGGGGYGGNRRQWDKEGSFNNRGRSREIHPDR